LPRHRAIARAAGTTAQGDDPGRRNARDGVPDKVFMLLTTDFPPGVSTGRHTHPGDEYGTLMEGAVMTRQDGGEWKTVNAGESYYVPANIVHETKNVGTVAAKAINAFVLEKGKPRVTAVQ
jgi:quercetin dioxygenase-like cupin family protein